MKENTDGMDPVNTEFEGYIDTSKFFNKYIIKDGRQLKHSGWTNEGIDMFKKCTSLATMQGMQPITGFPWRSMPLPGSVDYIQSQLELGRNTRQLNRIRSPKLCQSSTCP